MDVQVDISTAVKVKNYKASLRGRRGVCISLPTVWVQDLGIKPGDVFGIYRDKQDRLVIVLEERAKKIKNISRRAS